MNRHCDLDLENNHLIFTQNTPAYYHVPSKQIWLQKDEQFRKCSRKWYFDYISPLCDLDIEDSEPIFLHDTLAHDAA